MHEDELTTTELVEEDYGSMLPDGWSEGDDFFNPDSWTGGTAQSGQTEEDPGDTAETENSESEEAAPTTSEAEDTTGQSADEEVDNTQSGQTEEPAKTSRILKLKVNHKDEEVDVDNMTDEELIAQLQKARAFDAMKDDQAKEKYRRVYQDQIDAGMTEAAARLIAREESGGKEYPLVDETPAPDTVAPEPKTETSPTRDFQYQVHQLKALYPDFKEMPSEVTLAVARGTDLLTAYVAYREQQTSKAAASLQKENAVLKQNAASAAKAPVKGVTGGGTVQVKADPLLEAFDKDYW